MIIIKPDLKFTLEELLCISPRSKEFKKIKEAYEQKNITYKFKKDFKKQKDQEMYKCGFMIFFLTKFFPEKSRESIYNIVRYQFNINLHNRSMLRKYKKFIERFIYLQ